MITLHQFPISHYCEKVRWALDYKKLDYKINNLLPGFHIFLIKKLTSKTSVPVIVDGKNIIRNSPDILNYLDQNYPDILLTPKDEQQKKEALELETYFDFKIGPHLRRYFYAYILDDPKRALPILTIDASDIKKRIFSFIFPWVRGLMKKSMKLDRETALISKEKLSNSLQFLENKLVSRGYQKGGELKFLVGNFLSRADIAAASLLAPLVIPPKYSISEMKEVMPNELIDYRKSWEESLVFDWVKQLYKTKR